MTKKILLAILTGMILCGTLVFAEISNERMERSFEGFSGGIDKLLLDTPHVYIRPDHKMLGFYLPGTGVIFTGQISMTANANLPIVVEGWANWFGGSGDKKVVIHSDDDDEDAEGDIVVIHEGDEDEKEVKIKKIRKLVDADKERLEKMDMHLAEFKKELVETVIDFGPILKGLDSNDDVVIVLFVKDCTFKDNYKTSKILMQIPVQKLKKLQDMDTDDPKVQREFQFNI